MPFGISELLASLGLSPPATATPTPAAAQPPDPTNPGASATAPAASAPAAPTTPAAAAPNQARMLALMNAFGGLRAPTPVVPEQMRAPPPIAPQGANVAGLTSTGNTAAIASLLAAGLQPQSIPDLGQLIRGR